jgi:hypothetical protein
MKMAMFFVALPMASAAFGKDTYAMSHPFAWKDFMEEYFPTAENLVVANNTDTCVEWVKLCIDDGHMIGCSGPQGNFQMHAVGAYERDSGVKSMEQLEAEFTQSMGDMSKYTPFFDYNMALLTTDLDHYIAAFDNGGIPYFASTFVDEVTDATYNSVLVQTPGSLASGSNSMVNIELLASSSSLLEARTELYQHEVPRASSMALEAARAHLAAAPRSFSADGKPVVAKVHRSFSSSDTSRDATYFKDVLQGEMTCSATVCSGKMLSDDIVEFRYVQASSDFQGPMSVAEWESYQVSLHNTCFDSSKNDGFDRLADNHWGHELGHGAALDKYINGQKAAGLPYRFYGGLGHGVQFLYIYGPNGWGCQVIGACTDSSLCPSGTGGYDMCTQGIKGHCSKDGFSSLVV